MVDFSEKVGRAACATLQQEFSRRNVLFLLADVSSKEELVSLDCYCS